MDEAMRSGQTPGPRAQVCHLEPGLEPQTTDGPIPREPWGQAGEEGRVVPVGGPLHVGGRDSPELQLHPSPVQQDGGGLVVHACERGSAERLGCKAPLSCPS